MDARVVRSVGIATFRGRPPGYTVLHETRWTGDRSLFTGVIYCDGSVYEGHYADLCVAGWELVANTSTGQPVSVLGTLPFLIQDVDGAELFGLFMFLHIARAPAQCVTDSRFVEQGINQRGRSATEASTSAWAELWRDVWCVIDPWRAWATTSLCAKSRRTPLLRRCWLASSRPMIGLGTTWPMQPASCTAPRQTSAK